MITLTKSKTYVEEYALSIVRIESLEPIEGSDFLAKTLVNGFPIVVRKDEVSIGDVLFYAPNESQLNLQFLSKNNLFEDYELNNNAKEYLSVLEAAGKDEARKLCGYFPKTGRIRMIRLRKCPSMGFLFSLDTMINWNKGFKDFNMEEHIGESFDTINDILFIKAYIPYVPEQKSRNKNNKRDKKLASFNRMIPGQFAFHYDTKNINQHMDEIRPDDDVTISVKCHGTSAIFANILVKKPLQLSSGRQMVRKAIRKELYGKKKLSSHRKAFLDAHNKPDYTVGYGNVYSSRTVIKNQYINKSRGKGYYDVDVWSEWNNRIAKYIPEGMLIYGEIVGYQDGSNKTIQKGYDYGCSVGISKLMIYRIVMHRDNNKIELDVPDVLKWTEKLIERAPELKDIILPIPILYVGTFDNLYPNLDHANHWNEDLLKLMANDSERFGMELNEPLCINPAPREGIVVRFNGDPIRGAFKLKCIKFLEQEGKNVSAGDIGLEMQGN